MSSFQNFARRLRYGKPIIVVSGLPRSGTSMAMRMLEAGGVSVLTDRLRTADDSNPEGYYELEAVKGLDRNGDLLWLNDARGRAVKIISFLLTWLPESHSYQVIFMHRNLDEVIASQNAMLSRRSESPDTLSDDRARQLYEQHLQKVARFLSNRRCFSVLAVNYADVMARPDTEARRMADFLGSSVDVEKMAAVPNSKLYRNRRPPVHA